MELKRTRPAPEMIDLRTDQSEPIPDDVEKFSITVSDCLDQNRTANIFKLLGMTLKMGLEGDVAEFGVFRGETSLAICKFLEKLDLTGKKLHMFDTFTGLPDPSPQDLAGATLESWEHYDQYSSSERAVRAFLHGHEGRFFIHAGVFMDYLSFQAPLCLAHIDPDLYEGVQDAVYICEHAMVDHGVIIVDDYMTSWNGVTEACDEIDMTKWKLLGKGHGQFCAMRIGSSDADVTDDILVSDI